MNSKIRNIFLTFFGSGLSRVAPGTVGTLAGLPFGFLVIYYFSVETLALLTVLITIAGIKETDKYEQESGEHDSEKIVIDEVAGIWLTLCMTTSIEPIWLQGILAFITFRLFDIWKPSIIGRIDRDVKGGKGVMLDDIVAGFFAGLLSLIIFRLLEYLF